jgi:AcrR family transcriptional regulator
MAGLMDTLRDQRRQQATEEIARAALELFTTNGYENTSVDEIAAAAGCSPRTFYRYFGTKEDVMFHDTAALSEVIRRMLREHLERNPDVWGAVEDTLVALISRFGDAGGDFATARLTLWLNEPGLLARFIHYMIEAEDLITECLRAHRGTTGKRDDVAPVAAAAAVAAYRVTLQTHRTGSGERLAGHLRASLAYVRDGIGQALTAPARSGRRRAT